MRVLQVIPGLGAGGGAERSSADVAGALVAAGVELHVAVLTDRRALVEDAVAAGVTVHDLSSHTTMWARSSAIRTLVAEIEPDFVHATLYEASVPAQIAAIRQHASRRRASTVPILVTWANTSYDRAHLEEVTTGRRRASAAMRLRAVQAIDATLSHLSGSHFHAVTQGVATVNARSLRVRASRVHVAERGRDPDRFPDVEGIRPPPGDLRALGVPPGARLVVAVGRQEPQKGYDLLFDAFDEVAAADDAAWLLIAGREGGATADLLARRRSLRHGDRVLLLGHRDDVAALLAAADVVVCASRREGAAGALIEAMACGRPIVAVPLAGLAGVLADGIDALIVPRDRLGTAISELLRDPVRAERLGRAARAVFDARFTTDRAARALLEVYSAVASSATGRRSNA